jgi:Rieske Fe-S protein
MLRRTFFAIGLALAGLGRRAWAQLANDIRFFPLSRPVRIPLDNVKESWQPVAFTAEAIAPATPKTAQRRVLISGVLFRRSGDSSLSALCLTCPHEQCKIDLITEPARLAEMSGGKASTPLFECPCHSSVFDAANDGAKVSGETPRGLYRFHIAGVQEGHVEITEIEEVALFEV